MFGELVKILPKFLGMKAQVRCFTHTVNLTAKGVLRPFELVKPAAGGSNAPVSPDGLDELYAELRDIEENGDLDKDDMEGFVEVLKEMTDEEREKWNQNVEPVRTTLFKV